MKPPPPQHPCPCCGHRTFLLQPPGTMEICPVCFWEDAPTTADRSESSGVSLATAQANYARLGACAERWRSEVRPARPDEARPPGWKTIEERRPEVGEALRVTIEGAFGQVRREGGISLHQAHVLDDYGGAAELVAAERLDPEDRWQEIPDEKLERLDGAFTFLDARGFRFYLPAYLRLFARTLGSGRGTPPGIGLWWYSLDGSEYHQRTHYALLDPTQNAVVATFLEAIADVGDDAAEAAGFLESYWGQFRAS